MKWVFSTAVVICAVLVVGAVGMATPTGQPETLLTETILAKRDHLKVLWAISEMCTNSYSWQQLPTIRSSASVRRSAATTRFLIRLFFAKADDVPDGGQDLQRGTPGPAYQARPGDQWRAIGVLVVQGSDRSSIEQPWPPLMCNYDSLPSHVDRLRPPSRLTLFRQPRAAGPRSPHARSLP